MAIPLLFNMFNVRKYGEIEFWMTTIKVNAFYLIILFGILLPMDIAPGERLLGTDADHNLIPCNNPATDNCVSNPGFTCNIILRNRD
jgi:amino acid permease